ncbi:MAG: dihydrolipoyl dehydrogenase [Candidatus Omnitrophota bacterium]
MSEFDLIIIGGGPGGYTAAIRAAQFGKRVCVFEKEHLGGVCLNWGCIPTKTLISQTAILNTLKKSSSIGINTGSVSVDFAKMIGHKDEVVEKLRNGVHSLFKARNIELIKKQAVFESADTVSGIKAKDIIIATGSTPYELKNIKFDHQNILTSNDLINISQVPESLIIIGGGVISVEFAWIFNLLGTKVTIIEMMPQLLPQVDREAAKKLEQIFKKNSIAVLTKAEVDKVETLGDRINVQTKDLENFTATKVLAAVGRQANISGFGLDKIGVEVKNGRICVNTKMQTNITNIYAIGDVVGNYQLAHVASFEGEVAAANIAGLTRAADYTAVPNCIYTHPEIATVGINSEQARNSGIDVLIGKFPLQASGRAQAMDEDDGFVKIVVDKNSEVILGAQIIAPEASELIAELTPFIQHKMKLNQLTEVIHAHPTLSEAVREAALSIKKQAIHIL